MAKINVKQGDGAAPRNLALAIIAGQTIPFEATIIHKGVKPLVVPSSGINTVILPGEAVPIKIKSFEQAWLLVTDLATLAQRYNNAAEDFATITVPNVVAAATEEASPVLVAEGEAPADAETPQLTKAQKAALKAADTASE